MCACAQGRGCKKKGGGGGLCVRACVCMWCGLERVVSECGSGGELMWYMSVHLCNSECIENEFLD